MGEVNTKLFDYLDIQKVDKTPFILVENIFNLNRSLYFDEDSISWIIKVTSRVNNKGCSKNKTIDIWNPEINSYHFLNLRAIAFMSRFLDRYYMLKKSRDE